MSYVLDGIPTKLEVVRPGRLMCPCGWIHEAPPGYAVHEVRDVDQRAALRFHYQWCSAAKVTK